MTASSTVKPAGWEHFPHDADVGVRGFGATASQAFEQAALALTAVVTRARVEPLSPVEINCKAPDLELLFVDWLNAIIYEMAVRDMLFARFDVRIEDTGLQAKLWGRTGRRRATRPRLRAEGRNLHGVARGAGRRRLMVGGLRRGCMKRVRHGCEPVHSYRRNDLAH